LARARPTLPDCARAWFGALGLAGALALGLAWPDELALGLAWSAALGVGRA
jgi:hypothetical protein